MISLAQKARPVPSPFTLEQQQRFDEGVARAIAKYPPDKSRAALLAALHLAQDELGWLSEPTMAYVGFRLDVPPARVREVATFYTMYRLKPVGRHHIGICNSVSCWAMGSETILQKCEEVLGVRRGETTKDGHFSFEEVACLAACGGAPALIVNNFTYVENVTPGSLERTIADLREKRGQHIEEGPPPRLPGSHEIVAQEQPQATGPDAAATAVEAGSTERKR
jgi:NADH-quinone oxidoreductase subunit E